jgi:hypothetical protein
LLRLAYDKEQARKTARYDAQQAKATVATVTQRMADAVKRTAERQAADRAKFDETLANDPDAAARIAFDASQRQEMDEVERAAWTDYVTEQTRLAASAIPQFDEVAPNLVQYAVERLGYDEAQVRSVHDARDLVTLYGAMQFDKLVQAGIYSYDGKFTGNAEALGLNVAAAPANAAPAMRQPPVTLSSAAGGSKAGGAKSLKQQADDLLTMSDADFDKLDPSVLDSVLKGLGGSGQ